MTKASPTRRERILDRIDLPTEIIHIPRWDQHVLIRAAPMASPAYVSFQTSTRDRSVVTTTASGHQVVNERELTIRRNIGAVVLCALDPDTEERLFTWDDAAALREKHYNSVLLISAKAFELAGGDGPAEVSAMDHLVHLVAFGMENGWPDEMVDGLAAYESLINVTQGDTVSAEIIEDAPDAEVAAALSAVPEIPEVVADDDLETPESPLAGS